MCGRSSTIVSFRESQVIRKVQQQKEQNLTDFLFWISKAFLRAATIFVFCFSRKATNSLEIFLSMKIEVSCDFSELQLLGFLRKVWRIFKLNYQTQWLNCFFSSSRRIFLVFCLKKFVLLLNLLSCFLVICQTSNWVFQPKKYFHSNRFTVFPSSFIHSTTSTRNFHNWNLTQKHQKLKLEQKVAGKLQICKQLKWIYVNWESKWTWKSQKENFLDKNFSIGKLSCSSLFGKFHKNSIGN